MAVELLLDALRIKKLTINKHGKRMRLCLHDRIVSMKSKYPTVHNKLLAIKWLGNEGSHPGTLTRDLVFDALDIFESVLDKLYSKHPMTIEKLVHAVNLRKGPPRKKP